MSTGSSSVTDEDVARLLPRFLNFGVGIDMPRVKFGMLITGSGAVRVDSDALNV